MKIASIARDVLIVVVIGLNLLWTSPLAAEGDKAHHPHRSPHGHSWHAIQEAVCVVYPTEGHTARGIIRLMQVAGGLKVIADIEGLAPNSKHAIHVHQFGDCTSTDGRSAGGHYNPEGHQHALPTHDIRHAGDLGNLQADANGMTHHELTVGNLSVAGFKNPVLGRAIIIHAKPDDGGQPTGNAGPRIGCGVIGIAKSEANAPATKAPATQPTR